jgi:hypothetical protein
VDWRDYRRCVLRVKAACAHAAFRAYSLRVNNFLTDPASFLITTDFSLRASIAPTTDPKPVAEGQRPVLVQHSAG